MKKPIYSNRLDHIFKSISGSSESELCKFKGNINSIDGKYLEFKPHSLTQFSFHNSGNKSHSRKSIINHVKERNHRGKNKMNFDNLKILLSQKQKVSVIQENKKLLNLSDDSEILNKELLPNYNTYSQIKLKKDYESSNSKKISKTDNFYHKSDDSYKVSTFSPIISLKKSLSKTNDIFQHKTRNISSNFDNLECVNKNTENFHPNQPISNFVSISTEVGSLLKPKSRLNSLHTLTNSQNFETGILPQSSKLRSSSILKNTEKKLKTSTVKFLEEGEMIKINRFSESNLIETLVKNEANNEKNRIEKYKKLMTKSIMRGSKSLIEMIEKPKKSPDDIIEKRSKKPKLQLFNSSVALNRFLISDFLIGEKANYSEASKRKIKLTSKFYEEKANKVQNKVRKLKQSFDLKNFGQIDDNTQVPMAKENLESLNKCSEITFNSFLKEKKSKIKVNKF
jgi:hypothetical protein